MALAELIARLEHDAETRVAAIRNKAAAEIETIAAAAGHASRSHHAAELARRRAARRALYDRELAEIRRRSRAQVLRAQHALLDRVFVRAERLAAQAEGDAVYLDALAGHVSEALEYLDGTRAVVRCRPALAPRVEAALKGRPDAALVVDPNAAVGVVVAAFDDSVEIDNTLRARLERLRPRLGAELLVELGR